MTHMQLLLWAENFREVARDFTHAETVAVSPHLLKVKKVRGFTPEAFPAFADWQANGTPEMNSAAGLSAVKNFRRLHALKGIALRVNENLELCSKTDTAMISFLCVSLWLAVSGVCLLKWGAFSPTKRTNNIVLRWDPYLPGSSGNTIILRFCSLYINIST